MNAIRRSKKRRTKAEGESEHARPVLTIGIVFLPSAAGTRQSLNNTQQRGLDEPIIDSSLFVEYFILGT
jgi:hypothetical protein